MNAYNKENRPGHGHGRRKGREDAWSFPGWEFTTEEVFWLRAVGNKMHMWPDFEPGDVRTLRIAKALGYRLLPEKPHNLTTEEAVVVSGP